jgi:hypothetical protein
VIAIAEFFSFREDWHQDDRVLPLVRQYQLALDAVLRDHPDWRECAVHCCHCGIRFLAHPRCAGRRDLRCPFGCRREHRRQCANARSRKHNQTAHGRANKKKLNTAARLKAAQLARVETTRPTPLAPSCQLAVVTPGAESPDETTLDATVLGATAQPRTAMDELPSMNVARLMDASPEVDASPSMDASTPMDVSPLMLWGPVTFSLDGLVLDESTLVNSPVLPYVRMVASLLEGKTIRREQLIAALCSSLRQRSIDPLPHREYVLRCLNQHPP